MAGNDKWYESLISTPNAKEARAWLRGGRKQGFTLGKLESTEESLALVEDGYAAGAVRVTAVEIEDYSDMGGYQTSKRVVVTLPDEPAKKRARALAWAGKVANEQGFDGEPDIGQRYVFLFFD
jgi:hypothetical protein